MIEISNYTIYADYYNQHTRRYDNDSQIANIFDSNDEMFNRVKVALIAGAQNTKCSPCATVQTRDTFGIGEGFQCVFNIGSTYFGNMNGYNGCVAFAWSKERLTDEQAIPAFSHYGNCSSLVESNLASNNSAFVYGLIGSGMAYAHYEGISLTLYPETTKADENGVSIPSLQEGTSKVSHFKLVFTGNNNMNPINGELPECFDLTYDTVLSVDRAFGYINFYLNGILFCSVDESSVPFIIDSDDYYFTASVMPQPYESTAMLEIHDISYCPNIKYPSMEDTNYDTLYEETEE